VMKGYGGSHQSLWMGNSCTRCGPLHLKMYRPVSSPCFPKCSGGSHRLLWPHLYPLALQWWRLQFLCPGTWHQILNSIREGHRDE
jgi:hypothetical protein